MITFEFFISVKGREARNDSCYYGRTAGRIFESYSWTGVPIEPSCGFTQRYHRKPRGKRETGLDTLIDKYLPETEFTASFPFSFLNGNVGTIKLLARLTIRQKGKKAITDRVLASARRREGVILFIFLTKILC